MRARMALIVSGVKCELREVKLSEKPGAMLAASPKGTVPVLVLPDGQILDESLDIMRWALPRNDPEGLLEGDATSLIDRNDGAFKHHLDRYKYADRHSSDPIEHRSAAVAILGDLDKRLAVNSNLLRDHRSLADIAIMPFVRQFAEADRTFFDGLPLPHLQRWLMAHLESELFNRAMVRVPQWQPGIMPIHLQSPLDPTL